MVAPPFFFPSLLCLFAFVFGKKAFGPCFRIPLLWTNTMMVRVLEPRVGWTQAFSGSLLWFYPCFCSGFPLSFWVFLPCFCLRSSLPASVLPSSLFSVPSFSLFGSIFFFLLVFFFSPLFMLGSSFVSVQFPPCAHPFSCFYSWRMACVFLGKEDPRTVIAGAVMAGASVSLAWRAEEDERLSLSFFFKRRRLTVKRPFMF